MALNTHFGCDGPAGWHVETKEKRKTPRRADLQRENRVNNLPDWVRNYLFDLVTTQRMRLCKPFPYQEEFLLSRSEARHWRQQTVTAKRKHLEEVADEKQEPKSLPKELWTMLNVSRVSLPIVVRPGEKPR